MTKPPRSVISSPVSPPWKHAPARSTTKPAAPRRSNRRGRSSPNLISLRLAQDRPLDALAQAERAKSGSLSNAAMFACGPDTAQCWTRALPADTTVVYYAQLADRLAVWVITPAGIDSLVLPVPAAELRASVNQYRRALEQRLPDDRLVTLSSSLFDQILLPDPRARPRSRHARRRAGRCAAWRAVRGAVRRAAAALSDRGSHRHRLAGVHAFRRTRRRPAPTGARPAICAPSSSPIQRRRA